MQSEDIDKLFRERLAGHAPTPPAFVWAEIEAEIQPRRKRPVLWLAAAAVALLTLLGGASWWVLTGSNPGRPGGPQLAATAPRPARAATPEHPENNSFSQATAPLASSSSPSEASANTPAVVVATATPSQQARSRGVQPDPAAASRRPARPRASTPAAVRQLALADAPAPTPSRPKLPEPTADPELDRPTTLPAATVALTGPIEVEVRPAAPAPAVAAAPTHRPRLTSLLRQARNAVKGERVSLTDAGLPETVTVQARVAGHTLTKTIQL
ncbi:hypothetical protein [Hymenobacter glacieicola]|uniref:Uncharacterized protein n=1 Tax=Hymenobacter glacieicola TaxID=1562124 RepID=A0ABQ1X0H5_9BACT|nr:hypothetical protein [Hymenobacter glacieicola]GGG50180.1 hypothetical protein GCM10011378_27870 [Hymenobacter glacieicola]